MNDRTKQLLESVGKTQSRRRRQDRGKQVAVDAVLESTRGARPSDQRGSLSGVDVQDEPEKDEFAPVAANLGINGDGEPSVDAPVELDAAMVQAKVEELGLKPVDLESIDMEVLRKGAEHELEHTDDINVAAAIAAHHVMEHPDYYPALDKMEAEMEQQGTEEPMPGDEAEPGDDFTELSPDSEGGVDAEGGEDEIED